MKNFLILIFSVIVLTSCNKDSKIIEQVNNVQRVEKSLIPAIIQHYQNITQPTSGIVKLHLYRTLATKDQPQGGSSSIDGYILDDNGDPQDFGTITVGTTSLTANPNNGNMYGGGDVESHEHYGFNTTFAGSILPNTTMYVPEKIDITNFEQIPGNRPVIQAGTTIEWNKDDKNSLGVLISVKYLNIDNGAEHTQVGDVVLVDDDGSYTFTNDFLSQFPSNSKLRVMLTRGNYEVVTGTDGRKIMLCNYSMMEGLFEY
jgi:hypothetical protein